MSRTQLCRRIWILVAMAAMFLVAPAPASAHDGHHHPATREAPVQAQSGPAQPGGQVTPVMAADADAVLFKATTAALDAASATPCTGFCCASMGCCPAAMVTQIESVDPPTGLRLLLMAPPSGPPGAGARTILEPPTPRV